MNVISFLILQYNISRYQLGTVCCGSCHRPINWWPAQFFLSDRWILEKTFIKPKIRMLSNSHINDTWYRSLTAHHLKRWFMKLFSYYNCGKTVWPSLGHLCFAQCAELLISPNNLFSILKIKIWKQQRKLGFMQRHINFYCILCNQSNENILLLPMMILGDKSWHTYTVHRIYDIWYCCGLCVMRMHVYAEY